MDGRFDQSGGGGTTATIASDGWVYEPLPSQRRFHSDVWSRFKGYSGAIGSGKSYAICYEALFLMRMNPGLPGLIGAPTFPMLRDSTQKAMLEVLDSEQIRYTAKRAENSITLSDCGSEILFRSLDNYERTRGTNLAWFGVDELTYCHKDAWSRLEGRLRHPRALRLGGFGAWTPKGFDWVYERFVTDKRPDHSMTFATPRENVHVGNAYYDSLSATYDEKFYRQEVLGEYLSMTGGKMYHAFDRTRNLKAIDFDPNHPICWALDFNVDPMCSVIAQHIDITSRLDVLQGRRASLLRVFDEICLRDANVYAACAEFVNRMRPRISAGRQIHVLLYGDAAGHARSHAGPSAWQLVKQFFATQHQFIITDRTKSADPLIRDRVNAVNALMCNAAQERRCFIDPRCRELVRDLEQMQWKADSAGNLTTQPDKSDPMRSHVSDSLGYLIETEFPVLPMGGFRRM